MGDFMLFVSSDNSTDRESFCLSDPPPTTMKASVTLPTLSNQRATGDLRYRVHLGYYFLNCVWRDATDPSDTVTANSGTSVSDKIYVTFYVGDVSQGVRLLDKNSMVTGIDCDLILRRAQYNIGELASYSYYTNESDFDTNYFFENQFTNMTESFDIPGQYIGLLSTQAMTMLRGTPYISVTLVNNREDDYTSPFWYRKFLTGVSLYLRDEGKYAIVESGTVYREYYKYVSALSINATGGPYYPMTLYTLDNPFHEDLYTGTGTISGVSAPLDGCVNLLDDAKTEMLVQQVGLRNAQNSSFLSRFPLTLGTRKPTGYINTHMLAGSDETSYTYRVVDALTATRTADWVVEEGTVTTAGRYQLPYPNGAWRGVPLTSKETALTGTYSPFPWEQTLTREQLQMVQGTLSYQDNADVHAKQLLSCSDYIYLNSGKWDTNASGLKLGERSLQFDMGGKEKYVNKLQVLFPKSQEGWQPTSFNATVQRGWANEGVGSYTDQYPAYWHGGYQHTSPYGTNDGGVLRHIHTLTQTQHVNGSEGTMKLGEQTYAEFDRVSDDTHEREWGNAFRPLYKDAATSEVQLTTADANDGSARHSWSELPNTTNPAYDFKRYEYGPFVREATIGLLKAPRFYPGADPSNTSVGSGRLDIKIAVCTKDLDPNWKERDQPDGCWFYNSEAEDFLKSTNGEKALGGVFTSLSETQYSFLVAIPPHRYDASGYALTTSSTLSPASVVFDKDTSTLWEANGYDTASGFYTGAVSTTTTTASGVTIRGHWIQMQLLAGTARPTRYTVVPEFIASSVPTSAAISSGTVSIDSDTSVVSWTSGAVFQSDGTSSSGTTVALTYTSAPTVASVSLTVKDVTTTPSSFSLLGSTDGGSTFTVLKNFTRTWGLSERSATFQLDSPTTNYTTYGVQATSLSSIVYLSSDMSMSYYVTKYNATYTVTMSAGYYESVSSFITAFNTASLAAVPSGKIYAILGASGSRLWFLSGGGQTTYYDGDLMQLLGYTSLPSTTSTYFWADEDHHLHDNLGQRRVNVDLKVDTVMTQMTCNPTRLYMLGRTSNASTWTVLDHYAALWKGSTTLVRTIPRPVQHMTTFRLVVASTDTNASGTTRIAGWTVYANDTDVRNLASFPATYTTQSVRDTAHPTWYHWLIRNFKVYVEGYTDYLVKEEYYFAPLYSQTDKESYYSLPNSYPPSESFTTYRPRYEATGQKMIDPLYARGRYMGIAPAYESVSRQYTVGSYAFRGATDPPEYTDFKCFSWRLCHQLFDFTTTGGTISNRVETSDTEATDKAMFRKRFEYGLLTGVAIESPGTGYTNSTLGTKQMSLGSDTETALHDSGDADVVAYAYNRLNQSTDTRTTLTGSDGLTYQRVSLPVGSRTSFATPQTSAVLQDGTEESFRDTSSDKVPLRRAADFLLRFYPVDSSVKGDDNRTTSRRPPSSTTTRQGRML